MDLTQSTMFRATAMSHHCFILTLPWIQICQFFFPRHALDSVWSAFLSFYFPSFPLIQSLRLSRLFHRTTTEVIERDKEEKGHTSPLSLSHSNQNRFYLHVKILTTFHMLKHSWKSSSISLPWLISEQGELWVYMKLYVFFLPYFTS